MKEVLDKLHPGLRRFLLESNWGGLRPIQQAAFQPLLNGSSCVIEAPTAGGKTEAVLFPLLTRAARTPRNSVQILYLAPLRALLNNLEHRGEEYASRCGLRAFKWHGDVAQSNKVQQLRQPPDLLLTTPESLEAILLRKAGWRDFFRALQTVIIDEAHNFAAGDRGGHLVSLLERLDCDREEPLQRVAVSATVGNPEAICSWLTGDRNPAERIRVPADAGQQIDYVIHHFDDSLDGEDIPLHERSGWKMMQVMTRELMGSSGERRRSLAFVRSRSKAESMSKALQAFSKGQLRVRTHHSAVSKFFREEAEALIQQKDEQGVHAVISTSTLELGIDIGALDAILQIDALSSPSSFLQRVGRTGRRTGKPRYFRGMTRSADDLLLLTATLSLGMEQHCESMRLPRASFHLLAHQLVCLSLQEHGISPEGAWTILRKGYAFSGISRREFDDLVDYMCKDGFLDRVDGILVVGQRTEQRYLASNWRRLFAVFDTAPLYEVLHGRTQVGTLDAAFVESLASPFYFTLAAKLWKAEKVDHERRTVKATVAGAGNAPKWKVFGGPDVPLETARRAGELLFDFRPLPDVLDAPAKRILEAIRVDRRQSSTWKPDAIVVQTLAGGRTSVTSFAGDKLNRTLSRLFSHQGLQVAGSYEGLSLAFRGENHTQMRDLVAKTIAWVRQANTEELSVRVTENQPVWRFSPFAAMLPEKLAAAALADLTTDVEGLQRFLRECELRFI